MINVTKHKYLLKQMFSLLACVFNLFSKPTIFIRFPHKCVSYESNKKTRNYCHCTLSLLFPPTTKMHVVPVVTKVQLAEAPTLLLKHAGLITQEKILS